MGGKRSGESLTQLLTGRKRRMSFQTGRPKELDREGDGLDGLARRRLCGYGRIRGWSAIIGHKKR